MVGQQKKAQAVVSFDAPCVMDINAGSMQLIDSSVQAALIAPQPKPAQVSLTHLVACPRLQRMSLALTAHLLHARMSAHVTVQYL
jgi:hypothetical protein